MRSIPNSSEDPSDYVLIRPAQRSPKSHLVPPSGTRLSRPRRPPFFCLTTVVFGSLILDFEASAVVANGRRHFLDGRELQVVAALLFAEGEPVAIEFIYDLCGFNAAGFMRDTVGRFIRRLRQTDLVLTPLGDIEAVPGGYRIVARGPGQGARAG